MNRHGFVARGGLWVTAQLLLMAVLALAGPLLPGAGRSPTFGVTGGLLMSIGGVFGLAGVIALGRHTTPFIRPGNQTRLVCHGIYRWVRHPLYASVLWTALGWAVFWLSWPAMVLTLVLALLLHFKSLREEQWLTEQFPEYADYRTRTKRFLPGIY
jgi:protein-S-isoprenylcysteine O-methyltransferase Ste14